MSSAHIILFFPKIKKKMVLVRNFGLGLGGFWVWTQTQNASFFLGLTNSEFNSKHFGVKIKKKSFMSDKNFLGLK